MANQAASTGENPWDKKELGALWKRVSQGSQEKYLSGVLNLKNLGDGFPDKDVPVIVFSNKRKNKDTHPDLRIYLSEKTGKPASKTAPAPQKAVPAQDANELI